MLPGEDADDLAISLSQGLTNFVKEHGELSGRVTGLEVVSVDLRIIERRPEETRSDIAPDDSMTTATLTIWEQEDGEYQHTLQVRLPKDSTGCRASSVGLLTENSSTTATFAKGRRPKNVRSVVSGLACVESAPVEFDYLYDNELTVTIDGSMIALLTVDGRTVVLETVSQAAEQPQIPPTSDLETN